MIIATAGHVDHGKTELIKALTGTDTDRLPEEKARGLSIDLGFAYQSLPNRRTLGFVDVPGHEKFIRNMLAGVGGIDLGLLVVAADDGVMPQTREHFAILDLLGIDQCVAVITKIDRVGDDRILDVQDQIETMLGDAGHRDIDVYPLCAPENVGVDALRNTLLERAQVAQERSTGGHFRMSIDRVFTLRGVGLVVTGMVLAGVAHIDDRLLLSSDGSAVRVRGIRAHDTVSERALAGQRCAINIVGRGVSESAVRRGDWLLHSSLREPTRRIDVSLQLLDSEARALKHWTPTHLHIGAAHLAARVAVLGSGAIAPGERGLAQLVLEQDAFVVHGDRFVLRDQSAQRTLAGGQVIDPFSPRRGRARPARIATLKALQQEAADAALEALTKVSDTGVALPAFAVSHNLTAAEMEHLVASLALHRIGPPGQERLFSKARWQQLLKGIEAALEDFHQRHPARPGASLKDIQLALQPYIETPILEQAIRFLAREKRLGERSARFHLPNHVIRVGEQDRQLWARAAASLAPESGSPLSLHQAAEALGVDRKTLELSLKNAVKIGEMVLVAKNRYLPTAYAAGLGRAAETVAAKSSGGSFSVAEYCEQTRIGRNFGIDLLEYFDRIGYTKRTGNTRQIIKSKESVYFDS